MFWIRAMVIGTAALLTPVVESTAKEGGKAVSTKQVKIGPGVILELDGQKRRVIITSNVVLRKGVLEGILTRSKKKEHEYILAADVDARHIHTGLELAGAKAGAVVQFQPRFIPPRGTEIVITLRYEKDGKKVTVAAREWLKEAKAGKVPASNWVFAGSKFGPNPEGDDKPPFYLANHGDLICLCNMETALLDLPERSPKAINDRLYEANTERIPTAGTVVEVILEPVRRKAEK